MKAFLFLLAGSAGLLLAGWGSTWLAYALTKGVLSLAHLTAAVTGLALASYGLGRWENRNKLPRACGTAYRRGTAMKAFLFLLAGSAGLLLAGWGSTWLAYALTKGVLSLAHLTAAVTGLALASYGLGRWELCD